jgi:general stress protein YciG
MNRRAGTLDDNKKEMMTETKRARGFASMNPDLQRQIASLGGKAAHAKGRAHQWTLEEARAAGRKGGTASHRPAKRREAGAPGSDIDLSTLQQRP